MNATQAENLRVLIRHMETKVTRTLDMSRFDKCGAPACALGEACVCPELAHLHLPRAQDVGFMHVWDVFGEGSDPVFRLFGQAERNAWHRDEVTPQEWALEARKVLTENGYAMDDGFPAFMEKTLAPVSFPEATKELQSRYFGIPTW